MRMKKILIALMAFLIVGLVGCTDKTETTTTKESTTTTTTTLPDDEISTVSGVENKTIAVGHYFDPMADVQALSAYGTDISSHMTVNGYVDYGTVGTYSLSYDLLFNDDTFHKTVDITVADIAFSPVSGSRPVLYNALTEIGSGSVMSGSDSTIAHPINPSNLQSSLLQTAVPSSSWWTSLLVQNQGGGNGLYTNPLRVAFYNEGLEITNPLDGFVQYWNPDGYQTIAQFPIALKDTYLRSTNLNASYITEVIDYSPSLVKVAMKNSKSAVDEVVLTLVQGSPYVFAETKDKAALTYRIDASVSVNYYDLNGNLISGNSHTGDGIVVELVHRHSGYDCTPPANVGQPEYTDKFYLINTPKDSTFTIGNHLISMTLNGGNYISVAPINDLSETSFYHQHGYAMITDSVIDYHIDYKNSFVTTDYRFRTQILNDDFSSQPAIALMPHHYRYSDASFTDYQFRTVRGTLKVMTEKSFQTELSFNGLLPGYTLPENGEFSNSLTETYLNYLDDEIDPSDLGNFYNDEGPYWNSKALYPLSQGIIIADQLGNDNLKQSFINKLSALLTDWYTYSGTADDRYLYYNNSWGSVYYSNDDFATASTLSDHSFTHGYLIYASAVLAMYDQTFQTQYKDMVNLLLNDYMYPIKDSANFAYLRNFDQWAGHSWAHGFGTFAEGNNLESTSEALNSWNAGYLWALATNDTARMEAAIYGFATELSAIKEYWFDYSDENWDLKFGDYTDVAGMVWGGKHDYATWFGPNPTFIYGIQWLPTGEYLTNYALTDSDYTKFSSIYSSYLEAKNSVIDTWYSNMWAVQAIINPNIAINAFDANLILNDDYPAELTGTYWMIHALDSLGRRTTDVWMELEMGVASSIYQNEEGGTVAMVWNSSDEAVTVNFYNQNGLVSSQTIPARTFMNVVI